MTIAIKKRNSMNPTLSLQDHYRSASDPGYPSPKLTLDNASLIPLDLPSSSLTSSSSITTIELIGDTMNDIAFHNLLHIASTATYLRCVGCSNITGEGFQTACFPNTLKKAVFMQCSIDRAGLFTLLQNCPELTQIHIDHCKKLSQKDIGDAKDAFDRVSIIRGV
jgi:hypothetical protein